MIIQAKLLKAIEEKKITRIGGSESKKIDVRVVAAINESPEVCINENRIRKDLYYRLSSIEIEAPPLRKRCSDINDLTNHFINYYNKEMNKKIKGVTPEVLELFKSYSWPGNVREFKNIMESAFNFASSLIITKDDIPKISNKKVPAITNEGTDLFSENSLNKALDNFEKDFIIAKAKSAVSLSNLADIIQVSRQTLNYKIKKYNIDINCCS